MLRATLFSDTFALTWKMPLVPHSAMKCAHAHDPWSNHPRPKKTCISSSPSAPTYSTMAAFSAGSKNIPSPGITVSDSSAYLTVGQRTMRCDKLLNLDVPACFLFRPKTQNTPATSATTTRATTTNNRQHDTTDGSSPCTKGTKSLNRSGSKTLLHNSEHKPKIFHSGLYHFSLCQDADAGGKRCFSLGHGPEENVVSGKIGDHAHWGDAVGRATCVCVEVECVEGHAAGEGERIGLVQAVSRNERGSFRGF